MWVDQSRSVGHLAASLPGALRVFDDLHIDYCCTGTRSLADACSLSGLDVRDVVAQIAAAAKTDPAEDIAWTERPLAALVDHIVATYHGYTRHEMKRLRELVNEARAEGGPDDLSVVGSLIDELEAEMIPHMAKEERILFPYVIKLEMRARTGNLRAVPPFTPNEHPLRVMMREHHDADDTLRSLRRAAHDYVIPAGASPSLSALYEGLEQLERTMHHHVHLESNVLFRRASELETAGVPDSG